jgi:hypothetical protein
MATKESIPQGFKGDVLTACADKNDKRTNKIKIADAAAKHGLVLRDSWMQYPDSMIHGWKQQAKKSATKATDTVVDVELVSDTTIRFNGKLYQLVETADVSDIAPTVDTHTAASDNVLADQTVVVESQRSKNRSKKAA